MADQDDAPSGLPDDDAPEAQPLGVPEDADEPGHGADHMPGIPTEGEPPSSG
jgi:hypothetical protein